MSDRIKVREFVYKELRRQKSCYTWLAKRCDMSRERVHQSLTSKGRRDLTCDIAAKYLNALGYKLVVMPIDFRMPISGLWVSDTTVPSMPRQKPGVAEQPPSCFEIAVEDAPENAPET